MTGGQGIAADGPGAQVPYIRAALQVLAQHGPAGLTVRRVAEAAGTSTMGVYTRFGSRNGILEALYRRAFGMLHDALAEVPVTTDPRGDLIALSLAYRRFALDYPPRYTFMFERPVPD
uniref:TetR/AcrR family transcriptional regulator n=1 Tax=Frankia gtarii TaxID=2950102 RepID=UPI0021C11413